MNQIHHFKKSASLVIVRKSSLFNSNFQILMMKRGPKGRLPKFWSFPGGVLDPQDDFSHKQWKDYLNNTSRFSNHDLDKFYAKCVKPYLNSQQISRRLAAIRQTYQEVRLPVAIKSINFDVCPVTNIGSTRKEHQNLINFLQSSQSPLYPDISSLKRLLRIITPKIKGIKRYDAQFYLYQIQQNQESLCQNLQPNQGQVSELKWLPAYQFLQMYMKKQLKILWPQFLILTLLNKIESLQQLSILMNQMDTNIQSALPNIPIPRVSKQLKGQLLNESDMLKHGIQIIQLIKRTQEQIAQLPLLLMPGDQEYQSEQFDQMMKLEKKTLPQNYQTGSMLKRRFRMYVNTGFRYERGEISKAIFDLDRSSGKKIVAPKL